MPTVLGKAPKAGRPKKQVMKVLGETVGHIIEEDFLPETSGMMGELAKGVSVPDAWPFPENADPLDALTVAGPNRALQLTLWVIRHQYPEGLKITAQDITKLAACTTHLKVNPFAHVWRRPAVLPTPGRPPVGNKPGVPPSSGLPPAPFVTIQLVNDDGKDLHAFRLMENNEEDNQRRVDREKFEQIKAGLPGLIGAVRNALGTESDILNELCNAATLLARLS